jgi:hypothetical protein
LLLHKKHRQRGHSHGANDRDFEFYTVQSAHRSFLPPASAKGRPEATLFAAREINIFEKLALPARRGEFTIRVVFSQNND